MPATQEAVAWLALNQGQDRRQHPRRLLSGAGYLILPDRPVLEIHTLDISLGGVGAVSPLNLPHELKCELHFTLAREPRGVDILATPVRVTHSILSGREHGFLLGLQFVNLNGNAAATIARYMAARSMVLGGGGK
jgi:c-di-GMP-binding flagellar brake protein YcgR